MPHRLRQADSIAAMAAPASPSSISEELQQFTAAIATWVGTKGGKFPATQMYEFTAHPEFDDLRSRLTGPQKKLKFWCENSLGRLRYEDPLGDGYGWIIASSDAATRSR